MYINIPDFGECLLRYNNRAKTIKAKLVENTLVFTIPSYINYKDAIRAITEDKAILLQFRSKILARPLFQFKEGEMVNLPHFSISIESNETNNSTITYNDKNNTFRLSYSKNWIISASETQKSIKKSIENICRQKAKTYIPCKINSLAKRHNFKYKEVKINSSKGKWGSCSSKGNINISLYCMMIPIHLLDLVLLHELCHTVEMNHGKLFWDLLNKVTDGKSKELTKELKNVRLLW